jgi:hypothetical protein
MKKVLLMTAVSSAIILSSQAHALDGRYVGFSMTTDNITAEDNIESESAVSGILSVGYTPFRYLSVELEAASGIYATSNSPANEDPNSDDRYYAELDWRLGSNLKLNLPVTEYVDVIAIGGYHYSQYSTLHEDVTTTDHDNDPQTPDQETVTPYTSTYKGWSPAYGVGLGINFISGDKAEIKYMNYFDTDSVKYQSLVFSYQLNF